MSAWEGRGRERAAVPGSGSAPYPRMKVRSDKKQRATACEDCGTSVFARVSLHPDKQGFRNLNCARVPYIILWPLSASLARVYDSAARGATARRIHESASPSGTFWKRLQISLGIVLSPGPC